MRNIPWREERWARCCCFFCHFVCKSCWGHWVRKETAEQKNYHWLSQGCQMRKSHCRLSCSKRMIKSMIVDDSWVSNSRDVIKCWCFPLTMKLWDDIVITQRIKDQTWYNTIYNEIVHNLYVFCQVFQLLKLVFVVFGLAAVFHVIAILFGAPVSEYVSQI